MSSKKIYTSVGIPEELYRKLDEEANQDQRSRSFIIEQALRYRYKIPREGEQEKLNADQS